MSKLVVVSNRVALHADRKNATGGLAVAILAALRVAGGTWFGWSGEISENPPDRPVTRRGDGLTYVTADLTRQDYEQYYNGFANRTLWPLFHFRLDRMVFERGDFEGYLRVNQQFANQLRTILGPDDTVWVHDYHLIPFARMLREAGFEGPIGFFLHTTFPPCELLRTLPCHAEIVEALCMYDLVAFQTATDLAAFHDYIVREAGGMVGTNGAVFARNRRLMSEALPISIDTESVAREARAAARSQMIERLRRAVGNHNLIVGIDRLDYSKGLAARFRAVELMLRRYPDTRNRAAFVQIAPLTRTDVPDYAIIRRELEELSGRINAEFAEFDWVPIRYLNRSIQHRTLSGVLRYAAVALVTPLRDGMNLVAKEFVAAQDPDDPGVLVLSRFAGAAQELTEAVIVNPYDPEAVADALRNALTMPLDERKAAWKAMYATIRRNDLGRWRDRFLADLAAAAARP